MPVSINNGFFNLLQFDCPILTTYFSTKIDYLVYITYRTTFKVNIGAFSSEVCQFQNFCLLQEIDFHP